MFKTTVEVKLSFVQAKKNGKLVYNKKGKPEMIPVFHRKLWLRGLDPVFQITTYRIVPFTRQGEQKFSVKYIEVPVYEQWTNIRLNPGEKWVKEGTYDYAGIVKWLSHRVANAGLVVEELLNAVPLKEAA